MTHHIVHTKEFNIASSQYAPGDTITVTYNRSKSDTQSYDAWWISSLADWQLDTGNINTGNLPYWINQYRGNMSMETIKVSLVGAFATSWGS